MKIWITLLFAVCCLSHVDGDDYSFPDPYPEVYEQIEPLPLLIRGWVRHEQIFDALLAERQFNTVVEVGVWFGYLTTYLAPKLPKTSRYFAIDHWKGSEEHQTGTEQGYLKNLFQQFLSNMIHTGLQDKVIPVRLSSIVAAKKFKELNIKADLIYLDAAHDYASVLQDLYVWSPLLAEQGVLCGDDWTWESVRLAVQYFAEKQGFTIFASGGFWRLYCERIENVNFGCVKAPQIESLRTPEY